jgi:hypothetical protein
MARRFTTINTVGNAGDSMEYFSEITPMGSSGTSAPPVPSDGYAYVWRTAYHVITSEDITNKYFDIDEEIADDLKDDTILTVETDVQSRDDYEVIAPSRISWDGKGLETDPPMQAGWRVWVVYPVKVTGLPGSSPGTSGKRYTHTQTTPNVTWNVQHNLGAKPTVVVVRDASGDEVICYHDWAVSTTNLLVLRFSEPLAGTALVLS